MKTKEQPPTALFPMAFFKFTLALTAVYFLGFSWYAWKSFNEFEVTEKRGFRLYEISNDISRVNETLTMSARMAATTGDLKWEKYYRELGIFLNSAFEEAAKLDPNLYIGTDGKAINKTRKKLAEIEKSAFDLVRKGASNKSLKLSYQRYFTDAETLLFSRNYENLKDDYTKGLTRINSITHERSNAAIKAQRLLGFWAFISVIFAMPIFIAAWLNVLRKIKYYTTKRNEAEEALTESERKYRNLVTEINEGFFISDKKGVITFANDAFARINGLDKPSQLIGRPLLEFIDPKVRKKVAEVFLNGLETGEFPKNVEARIFRKDGSTAFVQISPDIYTEGRSLVGIRGIMMDITERKAAEEELLRSRNDLSILNNIASVINHTMGMDELCSKILSTLKSLDMFKPGLTGSIFMLEGEKMKLVSHIGHSDYFIELHMDLRVGDCLCGLAAKTGESIISGDSVTDPRHTVKYAGKNRHGSIVIPLKAREVVIGVLCLYVPAGFDMDERNIELLKSVANQAGVALDNARMYEETKKSSLHDPLTGIPNRRMMNTFLEANYAKAKTGGKPFSVIMLDVDHFKKYNDTLGHTAGDRVLIQVSKILTDVVRGADLAARYGGEEFIIILTETDLKGAGIVAEKIRRSVENNTEVTTSLGVSCFSDDIKDGEELIKKADSALYEAKKTGRNRVEVGV
ncbi:MAG: diguanylate cyclase [Thermodesulfovibrionia bacterium]|nr:diguanylate cyclase [Thermodesulfovibrionia bacterium]